jgi:Protein of unknown function (DUF3011)
VKLHSKELTSLSRGVKSCIIFFAFAAVIGLASGLAADAAHGKAVSVSKVEIASAESIGEIVGLEAASFNVQRYRYVRCNSTWRRRKNCDTWGRNPVRLWRKHSNSSCNRGRDWNTWNGGRQVWVDNGCQATFQVRRF